MKILSLLFTFLVLAEISFGQIPLNFNHLTSDDGLTSNNTSCLLKDSRGFIWIGTDAGLNRFDGNNVKTYTHKIGDSSSLVTNDINTLFEDELHRIWIGTSAGLSILEPDSSSFINFTKVNCGGNSIDLKGVKSINQFQAKIWIATTDKILTTPLENFSFEISVENLTPKKDRPAYFLPNKSITTNSAIWFLASTGPICIEDGLTFYNWDHNPHHLPIFEKFKNSWISSLYNDGDSVLYFATFFYAGLYRYRLANQQLDSIPFINKEEVNGIWTLSLTRINSDELMGSTWRNGIYTLNTKSEASRFYLPDKTNLRSIGSRHSNHIIKDNDGTVFVATDQGLNYYNPSQLQFKIVDISNILDGNMSISITKNGLAIEEDDQGNLWFGTQLGGLFSFSPATGKTEQFTFPGRYNRIWSIYHEHDKLILGTDGGLATFSIPSKIFKSLKNEIPEIVQRLTSHSSIPASSTFILKDPSGSYWIAIFPYGLLKYNFETREYIHYTSNDSIYHLPGLGTITSGCIDNDGILWLGYKSNDFSAINTHFNSIQNFKIQLKEDVGANGSISSVACDDEGNLWMATTQAGLLKYNIALKSFTSYDTRKGLSNDILGSVVIDAEGNLWTNATKGLNSLDPKTEIISTYNSSDGFLSDQFDLAPIFVSQNGTLYTCSDKYLLSFSPRDMPKNTNLPTLVFQSYQKYGEEYVIRPNDRQIEFNFRDRNLTFNYYGINFIDPKKTSYAYKLEGYDQVWQKSDVASATYNSIKAGKYTLRIKVTNKTDGEWSPETTMNIRVYGPLWLRGWFLALCFSFCLLVAFAIYKYKLAHFKKIQAIRNKISKDLHDEIGSTLGSISIFSKAAEMMKADQHDEILSTVRMIGTNARNAMENMSDIVWAIQPSNDTLKDLMDRLQLYAFKMLEAKNITLQFDIPEDMFNAKLTLHQRRNIYLILCEAIHNVAKYSNATHCIVTAEIILNKINLQIKDDGLGFDPVSKSLGGNGFINMKQRAQELNAVFTVFTEKLRGTILTLQFKNS